MRNKRVTSAGAVIAFAALMLSQASKITDEQLNILAHTATSVCINNQETEPEVSIVSNKKELHTATFDSSEIFVEPKREMPKQEEVLNVIADFDITVPSTMKSFESHTAFGKKTAQQRLQNIAWTDEYGFKIVNDRYCVALGSRFTSVIGQYFDITLENGTVIPCVLSDQKDDKDTDDTNTYMLSNHCSSEFCVNTDMIPEEVKLHGDCSYLKPEWQSKVCKITVYDKNALK